MINVIDNLIWVIAPAVAGIVVWYFKKLSMRMDDSYRKNEVDQIIDLKLKVVRAELATVREANHRLEMQLTRLEIKIDKLIDKLSK